MIDSHIYNPKSQKYYVRKYFEGIKDQLKGRKVIDIPAGNGATTEILLGAGADVEAFDLFPEYFMLKEMECKRADITESIPLPNGYADWVTCQEGIEHFSDQARTFREINRVLKKHGRLLLTTPSYSNLSAKLSYPCSRARQINRCPRMKLTIYGWPTIREVRRFTTGIFL